MKTDTLIYFLKDELYDRLDDAMQAATAAEHTKKGLALLKEQLAAIFNDVTEKIKGAENAI